MKDIKFNFEDLKVYQKALAYIDVAYQTIETFPKNEDYALTSQYRRTAISIALNIAEGSIKECVVCSTIAKRQNYINSEQDYQTRLRFEELSKMTTSLQKYLKSNDSNSNN